MWERDIDAGLNYLTMLPTEGPEALVDDRENAPSFGLALYPALRRSCAIVVTLRC